MGKYKSVFISCISIVFGAVLFLGSIGYINVALAAPIVIATQADYDTAVANKKEYIDETGSIKPKTDFPSNKVIIGMVDGAPNIPAIGELDDWKEVYGSWSNADNTIIENNVVVILSGTMGNVMGSYNGGKTVNSSTIGNAVNISGVSSIHGSVYGGWADKGDAAYNEVTVSGDNVVVDGSIIGGFSNEGKATHNIVTINGGTAENGIIGGYVANGSCNAENNIININGGKIGYHIYGGYGDSSSGKVTNNIVNISGTPIFSDTVVIYGGYSYSGEANSVTAGNELNIHTGGLQAGNVENFEYYNFYLQSDTSANDVLLTLNNGITTDVSSSKLNVNLEGSTTRLQVGDSITLLKNEAGIKTSDSNTKIDRVLHGVSLEYEFSTAPNGDSTAIVSTVTTGGIMQQAKSPVETQAVGLGFVNSGADLLVSSGMTNAVTVTEAGGTDIFGAMGGGCMRYKTGSYADVQGYNLALGFGKAMENKAGKLTVAPFVEYGWGDYTSHLDSGIRGDGSTKYYGIGVLARQDDTNGVYYEGSLRCGRMDATYASNDMLGSSGKVYASYDSSSNYYGVHVGIGKIVKMNDTDKTDVYAKLLHTHQTGDSVALRGKNLGETYDFNSIDSSRIRIGGRLSRDYNERGTGYAGLAYEYEFAGEARATVQGLSTPSPSIQGSSALLELGYILQTNDANDPVIDIGLQGWLGKKQGVSGSVNFVWKF